jgi:hypothetical protein
MEDEVWKDIEGYEGFYQVSDKGRIKSLDRIVISGYGKPHRLKGKILKAQTHHCGYLEITLHKDGKKNTHKVHRLVAEAFIQNIDNLKEVNHKNEDKTDNQVENLEWCNRTYNINYGTSLQRRAEKCSKKVYQYTLTGELVKVWNSTAECGRNGYAANNISNCCRRKYCYKTHKGFRWSYEPLETPNA